MQFFFPLSLSLSLVLRQSAFFRCVSRGFRQICRFGSHGTAGTTAHNHTMTWHTRVNGIISVSWNRFFGTMAQYCFHGASLGPNLAAFLYRITHYIDLYFNPRGVRFIWVLLTYPSCTEAETPPQSTPGHDHNLQYYTKA